MATHSTVLAWDVPWTEKLGGLSPWACRELDMTEHICTIPKQKLWLYLSNSESKNYPLNLFFGCLVLPVSPYNVVQTKHSAPKFYYWGRGYYFLKQNLPLLGIYPEKTLNSERHMHPSVYSSAIYSSQTKCPLMDTWIKMWFIYTKEYYSAIKRMKSCYWQQHEWTWRLLYWVK